MSVASPARSLVSRCIASTRANPTAAPVIVAPASICREFHSTTSWSKGSRFRNAKAEEMRPSRQPGEAGRHWRQQQWRKMFPLYTEEELKQLEAKYSPEQMEALMAGEKAINYRHFAIQGRLRDDMFRPTYIDDYTVRDPRYDLREELQGTPREPRWTSEQEFEDEYIDNMASLFKKRSGDVMTRAMVRAMRKVKRSQGSDMIDLTEEELDEIEKDPELIQKYTDESYQREVKAGTDGPKTLTRSQAKRLDELINTEWMAELDKFEGGPEMMPTHMEVMEQGPAGPIRAFSAEAPDLGKVPGVEGLYNMSNEASEDAGDDSGTYTELKHITGMSLVELRSLYTKVLVRRSVHNQTRLGKVRSMSILAIAGNGNGRLGIGIAKSTEPNLAIDMAKMLAIRNMKPIRRYENRTVYGNITGKVSGTVVELQSRPPGFGLRVPERIFEMCRAVGLHDMAARIPRSKNPLNSVKATYEALMNQPDPEEIAIGRGKKLVDARKVYYGGAVY